MNGHTHTRTHTEERKEKKEKSDNGEVLAIKFFDYFLLFFSWFKWFQKKRKNVFFGGEIPEIKKDVQLEKINWKDFCILL